MRTPPMLTWYCQACGRSRIVNPNAMGLTACVACGSVWFANRPPLDPDPLHVEAVEPGPVELRAESADWFGCVALLGAFLFGAALALLVLALLAPAPRYPASTPVRPSSGAPSQAVPVDGGAPLPPAAAQQPATLVVSEPASLPAPLVGVKGWATWFAACDRCAAAGPALRRALGSDWRGQWVMVCHDGVDPGWNMQRCVVVKLTDWCACGPRHGTPTVIDLSRRAFGRIANLGSGVIPVTVEAAGGPPPALPATDTAP